MFHVVPGGRKYVPRRSSFTDDSPLTVQAVHRLSRSAGTPSDAPEGTWPPPGAKMRNSKGGVVVRAYRRNASSQAASLESLEAAWNENTQPEVKAAQSSPTVDKKNRDPDAAGNGLDEHGGGGGGPPRSRRRGFRAPDVRTIFSPSERDPRVKEESGEGHTFEPGGESTWCDLCCKYIFERGLTCAGCKYACHAACRDKVSLDCNSAASCISQDQLNNNNTHHHHHKSALQANTLAAGICSEASLQAVHSPNKKEKLQFGETILDQRLAKAYCDPRPLRPQDQRLFKH
ncbi:hypothetical protein Q5P01_003759 [Channa striata]|uniref:Phorbol-ester/DAG-type domain-containing protein n=1 Tax=Channa striata TaxID=64152 RepID=A0AA88T1M4_CHASR|nr:hypothetical protein Q5P01_003759 [Channa striata]